MVRIADKVVGTRWSVESERPEVHGRHRQLNRPSSAGSTVHPGRNNQSTQIREGTNQIQRVVMAKELLG